MVPWYYLDESGESPKPVGPLSLEQLRSLMGTGQLRATTRVAQAGGATWMRAADEPALADLFRSAPPRAGEIGAPPRADSPNAPPLPATVGIESVYSFGSSFELAWGTFKRQWLMLVMTSLLSLTLYACVAAPQILVQFVATDSFATNQPGSEDLGVIFGSMCAGLVMQILVGMPLTFGVIYAGAQATRGQLRIGDIFMGFRRFGRSLFGGVVLAVAYFACLIVAYVPMFGIVIVGGVSAATMGGGGAGGATFTMFGFMIAGMILTVVSLVVLLGLVMMRLAFAPVIAIDPVMGNIPVMDAFSMSWALTRKRGLSMLAVLFIGSLLTALTIFLLIIGYLLVGLPFLLALAGSVHELINRRSGGAPRLS